MTKQINKQKRQQPTNQTALKYNYNLENMLRKKETRYDKSCLYVSEIYIFFNMSRN